MTAVVGDLLNGILDQLGIDSTLLEPVRLPTGVPATSRTIGQFKALPPNFTIVYQPWSDTWIQPSIGVGAIYLLTYDTDVNNRAI